MNATTITVPQADPGAGYRAHKDEIDAAVLRALNSGWYILGQEGAAFEKEFAAWQGAQRAVGCANGTDALMLTLRGMGIGAGCTVVTVSHTAVATVAAIEMTGATPLLVDIDPDTFTMDPDELVAVLNDPPPGLPPIRAIIPVHLYGQSCDLDPMLAACREHGVMVIEDCSQAHGATLGGRKVGTMGDAACFSLYPTKNLGALGDGGVMSTDDAALADRIGAIRQYGWKERYISDSIGVNSRLDEVQAAILRTRLPYLDGTNARRAEIAAAYDAALANGPYAPPVRRADAGHVYHQYVLRVPNRTALMARLRAEGVATAIHYPAPVHLQPAYRGRTPMGPAGCAETARAASEVMSLPMFPELTDTQVEHVCQVLRGL
ncbi:MULTISPECIES: DegT/DnrJ/EryC1/StrS family aminotransferase [Roseomonadaceae]|uniref:DegT/DnrJ/EryC1/StrS family aminotransferase n=1 Tax=Falsiroseomonas oleicola TaxID=2801474 RepID=A0ABS6H8F8_9PROT|nr:DegT/DnrJ/EryC1/StrS family aminotransferase [Roseomonas oleicola]MBU8544092.1 DegT/DnrJ/EryC1/StrS family aminotransferase [Roseomonas oleicola]